MIPRVLSLLAGLVLVGCVHESKELIEAREVYWIAPDGGLAAHAGSASNAEVDRIRTEIGKMAFPVREDLFRKLIPLSVKPKTRMNWDNFRGDAKGCLGGTVYDYWLNTTTVLRVAITYYYVNDEPYDCIESAEVIDPARAYTDKVEIYRR